MLFTPLDQFEDQVEGFGFGETFDPGHDLDAKLTKGDALVDGQQFLDHKITSFTFQLVYNEEENILSLCTP